MDGPNDPLPPKPVVSELASQDSRNPQQPRVFYGHNGLRAGWRLLAFVAILSAFFSAAALADRLIAHGGMALRGAITPQAAILGEGISFVFVLLASWIMASVEGQSVADYGLPRLRAFGVRFWEGAAVGFASISALLGAMRLAGAFHVTGLALHGVAIWKYAAVWGVAFVMVGLFEEFLFRGYCLFTLTTGMGFWPAASASSLVFGYVHHGNSGETWVGAFAAGLVGLLFCLLLRRTGDLWMPIGFHAAWDWGETYFYGVPDSGQVASGHLFNVSFSGARWLTGGTVGPEGSWLCIALIVLLGFIFAAWLPQANYPSPTAVSKSRLDAQGSGMLTQRNSLAQTDGQ